MAVINDDIIKQLQEQIEYYNNLSSAADADPVFSTNRDSLQRALDTLLAGNASPDSYSNAYTSIRDAKQAEIRAQYARDTRKFFFYTAIIVVVIIAGVSLYIKKKKSGK